MKSSSSVAVAALAAALLVWGMDFLALRPLSPIFFVVMAGLALVAVCTSHARRLRIASTSILALALCLAALRVGYFARLKERQREFATYVDSIRHLQSEISAFCNAHPEAVLTNLTACVAEGALHPVDTNFLNGSVVVLFPCIPGGKDSQTFMEIYKGSKRTIVSQAGGVFEYDTNKINYLGTSDQPSENFKKQTGTSH